MNRIVLIAFAWLEASLMVALGAILWQADSWAGRAVLFGMFWFPLVLLLSFLVYDMWKSEVG